jgi:hypothetical protein
MAAICRKLDERQSFLAADLPFVVDIDCYELSLLANLKTAAMSTSPASQSLTLVKSA